MSEERLPIYHCLPPVAPSPPTAAKPSVPQSFTFHPQPISHQQSSWFTQQDMAAYRSTSYVSLHNVGALQMYKPQFTPIIDRWVDTGNDMPPPPIPGSSSPSPAHSANVLPSFSMSRSVEPVSMTKHKNESEPMFIDLSASTHTTDSFSLKQTKDQINGQITSKTGTNGEEALSVVDPNPFEVIKSVANGGLHAIPDTLCIQKSAHIESFENKFNKPIKNTVDSSIQIKIEDTNSVEKMLENIFQTNNSENPSVINTIEPVESLSQSIMRAESVEKVLKTPSPGVEQDKSEDSSSDSSSLENSPKKLHDTHFQFLEVENKLEELFGGVIATNSTNESVESVVSENKPKPVIPAKRPYNEKKKQNIKNKKPIKNIKKTPYVPKPKPKPVEPADKKYKGPVLKMAGSIENPSSYDVINRTVQDDEDGRINNRKTLLYKPEVNNGENIPDKSNIASSDWLCVFCSRAPGVIDIGYDPAGDLFGPYYVSIPDVIETNANTEEKKSEHNLNDNDTSETFIEVWAHENCLVWASGVYMIGTKIFGLEETVRISKNNVCIYCGAKGASIGCSARHCESTIHYSCAVHVGWDLDGQSFITTCDIHKKSLPGSSFDQMS